MANYQRSLKSKSGESLEDLSSQSTCQCQNDAGEIDRLERLYNHLPFTCFVLDRSGTIVWLNDWGVSQLSYTAEELRDRSIFEIINWPDFVNPQQWLDCCLHGGKPGQHSSDRYLSSLKEIVGNIKTKQGNFFSIKTTFSWVPQKESVVEPGRSIYICLICHNITEDDLAWQSDRLFAEEVMQQTSDLILWLDDRDNIARCNHSLMKITGYDSSELIGQNICDRLLENTTLSQSNSNHSGFDRAMVSTVNCQKFRVETSREKKQSKTIRTHSSDPSIDRQSARSLTSETGWQIYRASPLCKNGDRHPVLWKVKAIRTNQGKHLGSVWVGQSLAQSKGDLVRSMTQPICQTLPATEGLDRLPDLVALYDKQLRFCYVNSAMENLLGVSANQALGKDNQELLVARDMADAWQQKLREVFLKGKTIEEEFLLPTMGSSKTTHQWYQVRWMPIFGAEGSVDWVLSIARNLKQRPEKSSEKDELNLDESEWNDRKIHQTITNCLQRLDRSSNHADEANRNVANQELIQSLQALNQTMQKEMADRQIVEKKLKENQDRLNLIVNTNADGLIIFNKTGCILFVNPAAAAIFGRHKKDLVGKYLGIPVSIDDLIQLEIIRPNGQLAIAQMQVVQIPWSQSDHDEDFCLNPLNNHQARSQRTTMAYLGSIRDVTAEKKAWEQMSWMKQAIESASDAIAITNYSGKVIYQNPAFGQLFEYKNCQDINQVTLSNTQLTNNELNEHQTFTIELLPESPLISLFSNPDLAQEMLTAIRNGQSWQGEASMQSQTGKEMQILLQADAIKHELGDIIGLICTYTDVTERRQSAEMLRKSLAQNQTIINTIPDALFRLKADGSYVDCNIEDKIGFCQYPLKCTGQHCQEILPEFLAKEQMKAIALALDTKQVQVFEYQLVLPDRQGQNRLYDYETRVAAIGDDEVLTMVRDVSDKAEAGRSLQESEERYRTLAEASHDLIFIFNRDASIHYVNIFAAHKLGSSPGKLMGRSLFDVFSATFAHQLETKIYQVLRNKKQLTLEQPLDLYNVLIWLHISLVPLRNKTGIVTAVLAVARDITERIEAEAALKHSEEKLRQSEQHLTRTLATAPIGITTCDLAGRFRIVNPALCQMLGYVTEELQALSWLDLVVESDRTAFQTWIEALQGNTAKNCETEQHLIRKDGSKMIATIRMAVIRDRRSQAQDMVATLEDITERKRSQEQLLLLSKAVESASDAIAITDCHGCSTYHNRAFEQLFKFSAIELATLGGPQVLYLNSEVALKISDAMFQQGSWQGELDMFDKQGAIRPIFLRTDAIVDSTGQTIAFLGIYQDISERKQLEEQLNQRAKQLEMSNTELEQFAYVASHDLQEPLRTIASYTQLLAKRYQGQLDARADKYIHYVVDGARRMQQLIEDLLKYSRVNTRVEEFQPVNCQEIFEQAIANLQVSIRTAQATVSLRSTCESLPAVMGDRTQLLQLFQNLIGNAIKYQQPSVKPVVKVAAQRKNNHWLFSIEDNGIGIDRKYAQRIFLIFQRLHTRQEYQGTGIGLAVCQKIVERHQGHIWVESQLGKGSTFYFTIPDP